MCESVCERARVCEREGEKELLVYERVLFVCEREYLRVCESVCVFEHSLKCHMCDSSPR